MIYYAPFEAWHLGSIKLQESQEWVRGFFVGADLVSLEGPHAMTVYSDGAPVACGGAIGFGDGRACLWSFMGSNIGPREFVKVHAITKRLIDAMPFRRLEMYVDCDFENGHRWARLLGFDMECERMKSFQANGADSALYAMVK